MLRDFESLDAVEYVLSFSSPFPVAPTLESVVETKLERRENLRVAENDNYLAAGDAISIEYLAGKVDLV